MARQARQAAAADKGEAGGGETRVLAGMMVLSENETGDDLFVAPEHVMLIKRFNGREGQAEVVLVGDLTKIVAHEASDVVSWRAEALGEKGIDV